MALQNRVYYRGQQPAKVWEMRAAYTPVVVRQAMGANLRLVVAERKNLRQKRIYGRGQQFAGRFSYKLRDGDRTVISGNRFAVKNIAASKSGFKYAQVRDDMTGYSKRLQMNKDAKTAPDAVKNTRAARSRNIRQAMRKVNELR